jgi:hypothetical protein
MHCRSVLFSGHALRRMFERGLSKDDVMAVLSAGDVLAEYPHDQPYPSALLLGFVNQSPVHVVAARDAASDVCFVITAYRPDPAVWSDDYKSRRTP